jgi:hypothetical protein
MAQFCRRKGRPFSGDFEFGGDRPGKRAAPLRREAIYAISAAISATCGLDRAAGAFHLPFGPD